MPNTSVTRARDLNLELTLLTSPQAPPLRGLRPLPAQSQPTRHTPTWSALRANPYIPATPRAALGGGK
jgi:hypothetical protein